jgi:hypothetical protein
MDKVELSELAHKGSLLYRGLIDMLSPALHRQLAGADLLQVVAAKPDAYFPLEFVYDGKVRREMTLCAHALAAIEQGACTESCQAMPETERPLCPLRFWGIGKVIEHFRHTFERAEQVQRDFGVQTGQAGAQTVQAPVEPPSRRLQIDKLDNVLLAASNRVANEQQTALTDLQATIGTITADYRFAATWNEWEQLIQAQQPRLLALITHTEEEAGEPVMEIGGDTLRSSEVNKEHIKTDTTHWPIVLLIGCSTGDPTKGFMSLPTVFRQEGAGVVLATLTVVRGRYAAPITGQVIDRLVKYAAGPRTPFGELMRNLRRDLLAQGYPAILSLIAYGDADWELGRSPRRVDDVHG